MMRIALLLLVASTSSASLLRGNPKEPIDQDLLRRLCVGGKLTQEALDKFGLVNCADMVGAPDQDRDDSCRPVKDEHNDCYGGCFETESCWAFPGADATGNILPGVYFGRCSVSKAQLVDDLVMAKVYSVVISTDTVHPACDNADIETGIP